jgi:EmrB/QacA subfamily drug resistance transporter
VVAVYSLVFAGLLFSAGAVGDRVGRKRVLQLGLVGYLVGSLLAAGSHEMWQLIACRALMGAAAALVMPATLSILVNVFPPAERARAIAIWAATGGVAGVIGPVGTGWLLGHFWFGAVFLLNVPIVVVALVAGHFLVPASRDPEHGRLDPVGAVLSIVAVSTFVYGLIHAPSAGWGSGTALKIFAAALVAAVAFVAWELHVDEPMLDIRFFRNRAFSTGTGCLTLLFLAMSGLMFLSAQYFQLVLGYSALSAAVRFLPIAPIMIVVSAQTPRLTARFGRRHVVSTGMLALAVGLVMFRGVGVHTPYLYILLSYVPLVAGIALAMSPMTAAIMSAVPARRAGAGSAMNDATRELGAALGVAILGSISASHFSHGMRAVTRGMPASVRADASSSLAGALEVAGRLPAAAGRAFVLGADHAFVGSVHLAVTVGAVLAVLAAVAVRRHLPDELPVDGGPVTAVEAVEETVELALAGMPPARASTIDGERAALLGAIARANVDGVAGIDGIDGMDRAGCGVVVGARG